MASLSPIDVAPQQAIRFFDQKGKRLEPTRGWTDYALGDRAADKLAHGFSVAGATKRSLLESLHAALLKAHAQGTGIEEFRRDFSAIVAREGWDYKGGFGWRTRTIFDTNLRSSYAAGKWAQIQETKRTRPYIRYVAVMDLVTRPEHRGWHGLILPVDAAFWRTHFPPNGWNCRCTVQAISEADLKRFGWRVGEEPIVKLVRHVVNTPDGPEEVFVPEGIDPGFSFNIGESWLRRQVPPPLDTPPASPAPMPATRPTAELPPLPPALPADPERLLPAGQAEEWYVDRFLEQFDAARGRPVMWQDPTGERLIISDEMFRTRSGEWKVLKRGRERFLALLADALKEPDEIWHSWFTPADGGPARLRRRYLKVVQLGPGEQPLLLVYEQGRDGWSAVSGFQTDERYIQGQRQGTLVYRRDDQGGGNPG
ncbi:MAG: PBECR2 nuclease fold domain-containing protein [Ferrovibrionaceae bacterium]